MRKDSCLICQIVEGKIPSFKIAENSKAIAVLDINGANPGHTFIIPKSHYPIIEQVPDEDIGQLFSLANKVSVALFDLIGAEGTNIFVSNGIPAGQTVAHFLINVVPRKQNDGSLNR
jgi:histidine triad (HIT) family protein